MEIGEGSKPPKTPEEKKPGKLKVLVRGKYDKKPVEGADVSVGKKKLSTDSSGIALFENLPAGGYNASAHKAFPSEKHFRFIIHYPKVTKSSDAESQALVGGTVKPGETTELEAKIDIYRPLIKAVLERRHIDLGGDDKYGHWWTVVDDIDSYGWWPKYPVGHHLNRTSPPPNPPPPLPASPSIADKLQHKFNTIVYAASSKLYSVKESSLVQTFRGVDGELNGCTSFGGRAKRYGHGANMDPHFMHGDRGDDRFQPVLDDLRVDADITAKIRKFADNYSGSWAWRFEAGQNCHSFQIAMMNDCNLKLFKSI